MSTNDTRTQIEEAARALYHEENLRLDAAYRAWDDRCSEVVKEMYRQRAQRVIDAALPLRNAQVEAVLTICNQLDKDGRGEPLAVSLGRSQATKAIRRAIEEAGA